MNWICSGRYPHLVGAILGICIPLVVWADAAEAKKNVLVIHSYHPELSWTALLKRGIEKAFTEADSLNGSPMAEAGSIRSSEGELATATASADPTLRAGEGDPAGAEEAIARGEIQIFHEYLDAKRYPQLKHRQAFLQMLRAKYQDVQLDVLMVSDDPAMNLVLAHQASDFADLPIVFLGLNKVRPELLNRADTTGVFEFHADQETALEGLRQTRARGLIIVGDSSETGQAKLAILPQLEAHADAPEKIVLLQDLSSRNLAEAFRSYPEHWPVLLLGQLRQDHSDSPLVSFEQSSWLLDQNIENPIYSSSYMHLGAGAVGGKVLGGERHAQQAVALAQQILLGTPVETLQPIIESESVWTFDAQALQGLDVALDSLPEGTVLINHSPSFYQRYKKLIWLNFLAFSGTLTIIALLIEVLRRRGIAAKILQENHQRYEDIASVGSTIFWELDPDQCFSYISGDTSIFHDLAPEELLGQPLEDVVGHHQNFDFDVDGFSRVFAERRPIHNFTFRIHQAEKAIRIFQLTGKPALNQEHKFQGYRGTLREITEQLYLAETLAYQATYDSLTGLINRQEFDLRLKTAVQRVQRYNTQVVLCYLDLDQFKIVNDTAGHLVGDQLLAELAQVLQASVRGADDLGRLGGDEFGLLLEGCGIAKAKEICETIIERVRAYRFRWENRQFQVGVSIGIVSIQADGSDAVSLLSQADLACYKAKDLGRGRICIADENSAALTSHQTQMVHLANIPQAIDENRFYLMQQPIQAIASPSSQDHPLSLIDNLDSDNLTLRKSLQTNVPTDAPVHFEVLLRLRDEQGRSVSPGLFIPEAERYGVIGMIDRWVLQAVLKQGAHFCHNPGDLISVNLSGASINDERFLNDAISWLEASNLSPHYICFEITETAAISHLDQAKEFIYAMKDIGVKFALDDFGSGLSSFGYLRELPVDFLKIDGSLVRKIHLDPCDRAIVALINDIAHMMGMETIAEFVENNSILRCLEEIGVDYAQGYGIGKPELLDFRLLAKR